MAQAPLRTFNSAPTSTKLTFENTSALLTLCGQANEHLQLVARQTRAALHLRGNEITVEGDPSSVDLAKNILEQLYGFAQQGRALDSEDLVRAVKTLRSDHHIKLRDIFSDTVFTPRKGRPITPKGLRQKRYVDAVKSSDVVFGIGPAGTGKTFLAMAMAVRALTESQVKKIVLTRPAVEAGERLGFLPGTLEEKISPYLRPIYDALFDMLAFERAKRLIDQDVIEIAPLAFMRGRTLNHAFVILDEAQNTTGEQMQMFLTRLGFGSKAVITGDITQSDLPRGTRSGLREADRLLAHIHGISFCRFTDADVVRHPLVQEIIRAYEADDQKRHDDTSTEPRPPHKEGR